MSESRVRRLNVNLPEEEANILERIAADRNLSITEVVRRAISTEGFLHERLDKNKEKLLLEDAQGRLREIVFR